MHERIEYIDFWLQSGEIGSSLQHMVEGVVSGHGDEYTVYWPKDSIRVIEGSRFDVALVVAAVLADPRTRYRGEPTDARSAEIARIRRSLHGDEFARPRQVESGVIFEQDRLLPGDIRVDLGQNRALQVDDPNVVQRLDLATVPVPYRS